MKNRIAPWLAVPPVLYLTALFVGPACGILAYSLAERDLRGGVRPSFSWAAGKMATDGITLGIVGRTIGLAAAVTAFDLLLAYPCAAALAAMPARQRALLVL